MKFELYPEAQTREHMEGRNLTIADMYVKGKAVYFTTGWWIGRVDTEDPKELQLFFDFCKAKFE